MTLRVLLVDDNPPDRIRYRRMLLRTPDAFAVTEAEDGAGALQAFTAADAAFDCVLLDHDLPDRSGLEVLDDMRARPSAPPVIMLTGEEDAAVSIDALQRGAADYLMKRRIDEDRLPRAIQAAVERARLARLLSENEQRLARFYRLASQTEDALFIVDADTARITECNEAAQRLLMLRFDDAGTATRPIAFDDDATWQAFCQRARSDGTAQHEWEYRGDDGAAAAMEIRARCVEEDGRPFLFAVGRDISLRRQRERRLIERSLRDGLTGAWNRRAFDERLGEAWTRALDSGRPAGLVMIDVDHFKAYNDSLGHPAGDACLQQVADALGRALGERGMLARYGGEEFAALLEDADRDAVARIGEQLRAAVRALNLPHPRSSAGTVVSISAGAASVATLAGTPPQTLVSAADGALYRAKQAGRDRVVVAD